MTVNCLVCMLAVCVCAWPASIAAQGPTGPLDAPPPGGGSGFAGTALANDAPPSQLAFRQFGTWLDDATIEGRGIGRVTVGAGYWRTVDGTQVNAPIVDAGYGISDRVYVSAFGSFYRTNLDGQSMSGVDDAYFSAKVVVVDAATRRVGIAVSPAMEVLSGGFTTGDRVHWALPISAEVRTRHLRVYMSGGYFSRGAAFGAAAVEWTASTGSVTWLALTDSYALETGTEIALRASDRHRTDIAVGLAHPLTRALAAYVTGGRTLTDIGAGGARLAVSGGISIRFSR